MSSTTLAPPTPPKTYHDLALILLEYVDFSRPDGTSVSRVRVEMSGGKAGFTAASPSVSQPPRVSSCLTPPTFGYARVGGIARRKLMKTSLSYRIWTKF